MTALLLAAALGDADTAERKAPAAQGAKSTRSASQPAAKRGSPSATASPKAPVNPDPRVLMHLNSVTMDPDSAAAAVPRLRAMLAQGPDSSFVGFIRQLLMRSLIMSGAPSGEIVAQVDSVVPHIGQNPIQKATFYSMVASALADREDALDPALAYAKLAQGSMPAEGNPEVLAYPRHLLGMIHLRRGDPVAAEAELSVALEAISDSAAVLHALAEAYEKQGKQDQAIGALVRAIAVFPAKDTTNTARLHALYALKHGSTKGLAERLEAARTSSRRLVALDPRRDERPAPAWKLSNLADQPVQLADFKGKVVVLDFWGSWCGPCRAELPLFQQLYDRYGQKGVAFIGMNWEKESTRDARLRAAKGFMERNGFTFPVVMDHDRMAVESYQVEGFPTVFVIDRTGRIRYRNTGLAPNIDEIMAAQIEHLLGETAAPGARRNP